MIRHEWPPIDADPHASFRRIIEGFCPKPDHGKLAEITLSDGERWGWCETCNESYRAGTNLHVSINGQEFDHTYPYYERYDALTRTLVGPLVLDGKGG